MTLLPRTVALRPQRRLPSSVLLVSITAALVLALLSFAPTAPAAGPASDPSKDLPKPPARCLLPNGSLSPDVRPCWINKPRSTRPTVVLWGDSHAIQMMPAVERAIRGRNVNFAMFTAGGCPPGKFGPSKLACKDFNADALSFVTKLQRLGNPVRVILGANWQGYRTLHRKLFVTKTADVDDYPPWVVEMVRVFPKRAPSLVRKLGRMGMHVDLIGETATVPEKGLKKCHAGEEPFVCSLPRGKAVPNEADTRAWLRGIMRPLPSDARLIEFNDVFCTPQICRGRQNGIYTFFDDAHISATRAKTLKWFFVPSIIRLNRQR